MLTDGRHDATPTSCSDHCPMAALRLSTDSMPTRRSRQAVLRLFDFEGKTYSPSNGRTGRPTQSGMARLAKASRLISSRQDIDSYYRRYSTIFLSCRFNNVLDRCQHGGLTRADKSMSSRQSPKVVRALHPHDHRSRRPRARPDLRLRHHRLCRRAMGPALDHHRYHPRRAGAGPRAASWRARYPYYSSPTAARAARRKRR